ncbi:MAG TPA: M48 family metallopeptidase [Rhodothermales bacterium]|nr:M48 family metallopeptidase [Rhodothermales bacterium]
MLHIPHNPTHQRSFFAWQRLGPAVLLLLFMLTGCATTGVNRGDVNLISMEEEWQLGNQLEQDLNQQLRLVNDGAANAYIERIGQQIVRQTELANAPWSFHIVDDDAINAFNTPGGNVYVNTGLILAADNVAQLVGVMAHEIAHGVARHGTERLTKTYGLNIGAGLLLGSDPSAYEQVLAQLAGTGAIAKFSRNDEREADELGVRYMYQAGYDPEGMAQMFEKLLQQRQGRPSSVAQFFSTHPLTESRIRDVRRAASQLPRRSLTMRDGDLQNIQRRLR